MSNIMKKRLKGFTLLELIIVIAIIAVLLMIAVPNMQTYIRMNRMQAANDKAQEVYMATQDYLTKLQTSGVTTDNLKDYFGTDSTTGLGWLGVDMSVNKPRVGCVTGCTRKVHLHDVVMAAPGADNTGAENEQKIILAANGIADRLSDDFEGAWLVVIYPKTFTVKYAVYSEQNNKASMGGGFEYNFGAVKAVGDPTLSNPCYNTTVGINNGTSYTGGTGSPFYGTVFTHSNSQEKDYTSPTYADCAYTGQYPIPIS